MPLLESTPDLQRTGFAVSIAFVAGCWFFTPTDTQPLLVNSLRLAALTALWAVPSSAALAWVMTRFDIAGRRWIEMGFLLLLFLPLYVQLAGWEAGFGRGGWYSTLIAKRLSAPPLEGLRGAVVVHAIAAVPWLYWIFRLGFESIPGAVEEVASLDAGNWQVFRSVTLPLSLPILLGGVMFVALVTMTEITVTDRYQYRSYAEVLYNEYALNPSFEGLPLQLAAVTWNIAALVVCGLGFCLLTGSQFASMSFLSGRQRVASPAWLAVAVYSVTLTLVTVPLLNLLYQAGIEVRQVDGSRLRTWSGWKCLQLIAASPWKYRQELAWSAVLAQLSVLSSVSIATAWAWWSFGRVGRQVLGLVVCVVCFATPGTLIAFGIIRTLNPPHAGELLAWLYDDTPVAPWIAQTIKCLPFACLFAWYGMRSIPRNVWDAARVDGARFLGTILGSHFAAAASVSGRQRAGLHCDLDGRTERQLARTAARCNHGFQQNFQPDSLRRRRSIVRIVLVVRGHDGRAGRGHATCSCERTVGRWHRDGKQEACPRRVARDARNHFPWSCAGKRSDYNTGVSKQRTSLDTTHAIVACLFPSSPAFESCLWASANHDRTPRGTWTENLGQIGA